MALEAGAVEVRIGAATSGLEAGIRAAEAALRAFQNDAQRSLNDAFDGKDVAPAIRKAAVDAVDAARRGMEARLAGARDALARGLIDEKGLADRAKAAGTDAAKQLTAAFEKLTALGLLPPEAGQRLTEDLTDAARKAGEKAGTVAVKAMREAVKRAPPMTAADWQLGEVNRVVGGLSGRMNAEITAAREQLFRGLIDPAEFQRRAQEAAGQFNAGILGGITRMSSRVKLPPELHQYMVAQLRDAGLKGGQEMGAGISRGLALSQRLISRTQFRFAQTTAADREALARGLIDEKEFAKRGAAASKALNDSLLRGIDGLKARGLLTPDVHQSLVRQMRTVGAQAGDAGAQSLRQRFTAGTRDLAREMNQLGNTLSLSVGAPLMLAGGYAVHSAVGMDTLRLAMDSVTGSSAETQKALVNLREIAKQPGLGFKEAVQGATQLRVVGMSAERAERSLREFGNAVARSGGGAAELGRVVNQVQQMSAAGRVLTQDLRPIIQTAPAVGQALMQAFGTISAEEIEALGLSFDEFYGRLLDALEAAPRVAGGARQDFESMRESIEQAAAAIGNEMLPLLGEMSRKITGLSGDVETLDRDTVQWALAIGGGTIAAIGLTKTLGTLGTIAAATSVKMALASGGITLVLGGISAWLIKNKLDALEAAQASDAYRASLLQLSHAEALGARARLEAERIGAQAAATRYKLAQAAYRAGTGTIKEVFDAQSARDAHRSLEEIGADLDSVNQRLELVRAASGAVVPPIRTIKTETGNAANEAEKLARALERLQPPPLTFTGREFYIGEIRVEPPSAAELEKLRENIRRRAALTASLDLTLKKVEMPAAAVTITGKPALDIDWGKLSAGAAAVTQGFANIGDAMGKMSDKSRRAVTGLSEITRALAGLEGGKLDLTSALSIAGGLAQLTAGIFTPDEEGKRIQQENTAALDRLRTDLQGFRLTGDSLDRALKAIAAFPTKNLPTVDGAKVLTPTLVESILKDVGMTFAEFKRIAKELDLDIFHKDTGLIRADAMDEFTEALKLSGAALTGWRNTVDDARRARDLEAKLAGGVDLSDPVRKLESEFEIFARFFELPNVRDLDLSDAVDRDALREVLQTLYKQFAAGTLDLQGLTRDEFLSLFDSMADGLNGFDEAVKSATRGMLNVPPIFDLALRRRMAALDGALGGVATPPTGDAAKPGDGWQPPKEITLSLETLAADFGALSRPVEGAGAGLDRFAGLLAGMGAPLEGLTDTIAARWEQLSRLSARVPAAPATVTSGSAGGLVYAPNIYIQNPPAGMDVPAVQRQVRDGLVADLRAPGTNPVKHAVREAVK